MPRFTVLETSALLSSRVKNDYLFEMEMWLKGIERFFVLDCLPLSAFERSHASLKNWVEEVAAVKLGMAHVSQLTTHLLGEGKEDLSSFLRYLQNQVARPATGGGESPRSGTAEGELASVVEKLDDFVRVLDELSRAQFLPLQTYLSLGRIVVGTLKADPNLGVLFRESLRPALDRPGKESLQRVLAQVDEPAQRGALASLFVELFKALRWTERIRDTMSTPATAKRALLLFALVRGESDVLCRFIRRRLVPRFAAGSPVAEALERLVFSTEMEVKKAMEVELVDVALMKDPRLVYGRMEDAAGILCDLYQQNVIALADAFSDGVDPLVLFPEFRTRLEQSLRLREDLWQLVGLTQALQQAPDRKTLRALVDALDAFRKGSMKFLMFKDWAPFERFHGGFSREQMPQAFVPAAHQLEVFLRTLVREVGKRSVLEGHPFHPAAAPPAPEGDGAKPS